MKWFLLGFHLFLAVCAGAQQKKPSVVTGATAKPMSVAAPPPASYEFDDASKLRIRELQYQDSQLEIEIQKMQVQIAQKKAQQEQLVNAEKQVAYDFAVKHGVQLDLYWLDPATIRFVKK